MKQLIEISKKFARWSSNKPVWQLPLPILLVLSLGASSALSQTGSFDDQLSEAQSLMRSGQFEEALQAAREIAVEAETAGDLQALATALLRESDSQYYLGNHEATLPPLERALPIYKSIDDLSGVGRILYSIGYYYERTDSQKMISYLEQGLVYAEKASDNTLRMNIANAMGSAYWNRGEYAQAIASYQISADMADSAGDIASRATSYQNIGMVNVHLGENRQALEYLNIALKGLQEAGRPQGVAVVLGNIGNAHVGLRDFEAALNCYEQSLAIHRETGYKRGVGIQLANISAMYQRMNEPERAVPLELEAQKIALENGDDRSTIRTLSSYGFLQKMLSNDDIAKDYLLQAIVKAEVFADPYLLLSPERGLAELASARADTSEAFYWYNRMQKHALEINDSYTVATSKAGLAWLFAQYGQPEQAILELQTAINLHTQTHCRTHRHMWHAELAELYLKLGDNAAAEREFDLAIERISDLDALIAMDKFRVHLFSEVSEIINSYVAWLASSGETRRALEILDWGRARELTLRVLQQKTSADFSTREIAALDKISTRQLRLREENLTAEERQAIRDEIVMAEAEYDSARRVESSATHTRTLPKLELPPADVMAIEYSVHEDILLVFCAYRDSVSFRQIPKATVLMEQITAYNSIVANAKSPAADLASSQLYQTLVAPEFANGIPGELVLVPCSRLWSLPFCTLRSSENVYLSDTTTISFTPSLHSLPGFKSLKRSPGTRIVALANRDFAKTAAGESPLANLSGVTCEVDLVGQLSPLSEILLDANEHFVKSLALDQYQLIHWATHTLISVENPERSAIVVGAANNEDGYLQVREIYRLPLNARLVVVSGCGSGDGLVVPGEGLLGMSHALLSAGSRATVLSRWAVPDDSAAAFMTEFYKAAQQYPVAKAVQVAQLNLRNSERWQHPAVWAAFFVAGDGDQQVVLPMHIDRRAPLLILGPLVILLAGIWIYQRKKQA